MSLAYSSVGRQIIIYLATPSFIAGVIGSFLNVLVFLSLRTFRQSSCAFYLTVMSTFNIGVLFLGIFSRITIAFLGVDGTQTSLFYCKCRFLFNHTALGTASACICLATIDQYFATCSRPYWQRYCNIKLARYLVGFFIFIFAGQGIPYPIFFDHVYSPVTNTVTCINKNYYLVQYRVFAFAIFFGYLPVLISTIFGLMAYRNICELSHRTIPMVRRELDKQLTRMVLVQMIVNIPTLLTYPTIVIISTYLPSTIDSSIKNILSLIETITVVFYFSAFGSPFYIYISVSERFRRQLLYVLFTVHRNRWRTIRTNVNQINPEA